MSPLYSSSSEERGTAAVEHSQTRKYLHVSSLNMFLHAVVLIMRSGLSRGLAVSLQRAKSKPEKFPIQVSLNISFFKKHETRPHKIDTRTVSNPLTLLPRYSSRVEGHHRYQSGMFLSAHLEGFCGDRALCSSTSVWCL